MSEESRFNTEEEFEDPTSTEEKSVAEDAAAVEDVVESSEEQAEKAAENAVEPKKIKKKRSVSLKTFVISAIAIVLATLMLTYSVCAEVFRKQYLNSIVKGETVEKENTTLTDIDLLNAYIDEYFYGDVDKEAMLAAALKAYVAATGDIYAAYYTVDELLANYETSAGRMCGIGINIVNSEFEYEGQKMSCLHVINVMDDSPAQKAGILKNDRIAYVGIGENKRSVTELGYDGALELLLGEEGTNAEFVVYREKDGGYEEINNSVTRAIVTTTSVISNVLDSDKSVGILKITEFDYTTPKQFERKLEELKSKGCTKFVIDLRYNPGGLLVSIEAVLSYFLNENDVYIQTKDSKGNIAQRKIIPVKYENVDAAMCNVEKENIGKYRDLDMVVLCNGGTASAAELFVANFKDYGLAKIVGENTFGKGKMQDTFPLNYGLNGAVKLTTHMYFSGGDKELVGYDGVGIVPDVSVSLSEEALNYNAYLLPYELDDQLIKALEHFN
ncbi:MAG: hypothetical protein E7642_01370 [Ruminococcaceae bacterium]|nr:hypothetical protein [Oscillospiraceae bacterium]